MSRSEVIKWHALDCGVRVPIHIRTTLFDAQPDKGTLGELDVERTLTIDVAKSSWNVQIPDQAFDLPIPAGANVNDDLRSVRYITGKADPGKNLEELAKQAKHLVPVATAAPVRTPGRWTWWAAFPISIALVGCALYLWRKKGKA
jgi:hypothetical protein